jgi:hypothetical protein
MRRILALVLLLIPASLSVPASAQLSLNAAGSAADNYQGPCDVVSGGCAEAHSVTHAMTARYSGPLFVLIRARDLKTMMINQTVNHTPDLSRVAAFGDGTLVYYYGICAQIHKDNCLGHGNDLPAFGTPLAGGTGTMPPSSYNCRATIISCASPWWIDPTSGLPLVSTVWPSAYVQDHRTTGLVNANGPFGVIKEGRNEQWDIGGGEYGRTHATTDGNIQGSMFEIGSTYSNNGAYAVCPTSSPQDFCEFFDTEQPFSPPDVPVGPYNSVRGNILMYGGWDGRAATNTITGIVNGITAINENPPGAGVLGKVGTQMHLGCGGDCTHTNQLFRDGMQFNTTLTPTQVSAIASNESAFYAAQSAATCRSTGDPGYFFRPGSGMTEGEEQPTSQTVVAWGLRKMSAAQTGPIADLRDVSTGRINTYGPAANGCGLDPAAATFCATHGCSVSKLYQQQGGWQANGIGNVHDGVLDMTASSTAAQPTVTFSSLNGLPTMHFSGAQALCTGPIKRSLAASLDNHPVMLGMAVVARRTGGDTTLQAAFGTLADATYLGFAASANTAEVVGNNNASTMTAADGKWHEIYGEQASQTQFDPFVDGTAGSSTGYGSIDVLANKVCLGGSSTGTDKLIGDIAEATITGGATSGTVDFASPEATIFSLEKAAWGALPH